MEERIILRKILEEDCMKISEAFKKQGWNKPIEQYERYVRYQEEKERDIIIAEVNGEFTGYLTIKWESDYTPFREKGIPEIVDFNVLKKFQRQGIGTKLMDEAENRIKQVSKFAGIGFGLYKDYGAAQILYIKRNYVPDGNGILINSTPIRCGEKITVNDDVVMCLIKEL